VGVVGEGGREGGRERGKGRGEGGRGEGGGEGGEQGQIVNMLYDYSDARFVTFML
jgi:hypothetical protein